MKKIPDSFYNQIFNTAEHYIQKNLLVSTEISSEKVIDILNNRDPNHGLCEEELAQLLISSLKSMNTDTRSKIILSARKLRRKIFGDNVSVMVPIEVTSYCSSDCKFCGWKKNNARMVRFTLAEESIVEQVNYLLDIGFSHIEISGGDDLNFLKNDLLGTVRMIRDFARNKQFPVRISMCLTPLDEALYLELKKNGLDAVLTWQETYDVNEYNLQIQSGPKAHGIDKFYNVSNNKNGYMMRLKSQESVIRSGMQAGLGAMLGLLSNVESDILATILHAKELIKNYRNIMQPLIIGMPVWNAITTDIDQSNGRSNFYSERDFELIAAVYLLGLPDKFAWIFPNCRVSQRVQVQSVLTAGNFTSTMVRVGPGGYLKSGFSNAFKRSTLYGKPLNMETVLGGEQFVHTYDEHENYLNLFSKYGLQVVPDTQFLN